MSKIFQSRLNVKIKQSLHDLSNSFSGTFFPGLMYPIFATKVVPGDTFQIVSNPNLRTQPSVTPFFTNVRCDVRYFYCRNLLLWKNFDEYITGHDRYEQQTPATHVHPYMNVVGKPGTIQDYISGCIDEGTTYKNLDVLPYRMYNLIYNEYYRPENYGKAATVALTDGQDSTPFSLLKASYKKDYFTSALPFTQAGDPVALPSRLILRGGEIDSQKWVGSDGQQLTQQNNQNAYFYNAVGTGNTHLAFTDSSISPSVTKFAFLDPGDSMGVNIDIREFRNANAIQRFLERSAINGNRYAEYMLAHFGVKTPDNSSFRPQYLGGGEQMININPVEQNAPSVDAVTGTLVGKGRLNGIVGMNHRYFFTEYGWIMAIMVIRPDAEYCGGVNKQFVVRPDRLEQYYNPAFQNVGMDEIHAFELAYPADNGVSPSYDPEDAIGYQERNMEYKTIPNTLHGELVSSMNNWVVGRNFSGLRVKPAINADFIQVQDDAMDDVTAVSGYPFFFGSIRHNVIVKRPMQYRAKYKF